MTIGLKMIIPALVAGGLAVGACSTSTGQTTSPDRPQGVLTGQLIMEGGPPAGGNPRPITGSVTFSEHGRIVATVPVGADGKFSQLLGPGSYEVRACTTKIQQVDPNGSHIDTCERVQAEVAADRTRTVNLPLFIVP